jgi:hypothetical protein
MARTLIIQRKTDKKRFHLSFGIGIRSYKIRSFDDGIEHVEEHVKFSDNLNWEKELWNKYDEVEKAPQHSVTDGEFWKDYLSNPIANNIQIKKNINRNNTLSKINIIIGFIIPTIAIIIDLFTPALCFNINIDNSYIVIYNVNLYISLCMYTVPITSSISWWLNYKNQK